VSDLQPNSHCPLSLNVSVGCVSADEHEGGKEVQKEAGISQVILLIT